MMLLLLELVSLLLKKCASFLSLVKHVIVTLGYSFHHQPTDKRLARLTFHIYPKAIYLLHFCTHHPFQSMKPLATYKCIHSI